MTCLAWLLQVGRNAIQHLCHAGASCSGGLHPGYTVPLCCQEGRQAGRIQVSIGAASNKLLCTAAHSTHKPVRHVPVTVENQQVCGPRSEGCIL